MSTQKSTERQKRMSAAELRSALQFSTERMQTLRREAAESRDRHPKFSELWSLYNAEVRAYNLSLHVLFASTNGEFGVDFPADIEAVSRG